MYAFSITNFYERSDKSRKVPIRFFMSVRPSVSPSACPHLSIRLSLDAFSSNVLLWGAGRVGGWVGKSVFG
jgi:hypothetical protein